MNLILAAFLFLAVQADNKPAPVQQASPAKAETSVKETPAAPTDQGAAPTIQRNPNIQINLIDNNALNDRLKREGAQVNVISEFSAVNAQYAANVGGLGRNIDIARGDPAKAFHGEFYDMLQNNAFNARTFFQVGPVQKTHRQQYGFNLAGSIAPNLSVFISAEDIRQSGFINGNVLVPLASERTPRTADPAIYAVVARQLQAFPAQFPNRPEIDPRMLNTNASQTTRISNGSGRLDWIVSSTKRATARYSLRDTYINSFQFVAGQNPNQRFRPQELGLGFESHPSPDTTIRLGANLVRETSNLTIPPGAVGFYSGLAQQVADLGPKNQFPIYRVANTFEYLAHFTHVMKAHQLDWGSEIRRYQVNDLQSFEARGNFGYSPNFGRSAIENLLTGTPSGYKVTIGNLYRGFRNTDFNGFVNDRWKASARLTFTLGLRYEIAGAPSEVNKLTAFPYRSDRNNLAPRVAFAYSVNRWVVRGGYGIAYGRVFPATYEVARYNPPEVLRISVPNPDLAFPLKDYHPVPGQTSRSILTLIDPNLVVPYSQQYSFGIDRDLSQTLHIRAGYSGSRSIHLFELVHGNRAGRPSGVPVTSATINDRRPDQRYYGLYHVTNMGRAYFDAAQASMTRKEGASVLTLTYTFAKAIDTGAFFSNTTVNDDELHSQAETGVIQDMKSMSGFDVRHNLNINYSFPLHLPTRWLSGWTMTGTAVIHGGTPFTVEMGSDSPPFGNVDGEWNDRPSILDPGILNRSVDDPDSSFSILRRSAFTADDTFLFGRGNVGRNVFRKDGIATMNLALWRTFRLSDRLPETFTFRAEAFNLTNHPQFDAPNFNFASASFGQITNTLNAGRVMQFSLSLKF